MRKFCFIVIVMLVVGCSKDAEKEAFYIPQNYTGPIAIVFDQKNGVPKEYKDGWRIYRIPESGVLYTQLPDVKGLLHRKFYYVDSSGEVSGELPSLHLPVLSMTKYDSSKIYVMDGFDGGFRRNADDENVEYIYLCLGKATKSDSLSGAGYKLMERVKELYPQEIK